MGRLDSSPISQSGILPIHNRRTNPLSRLRIFLPLTFSLTHFEFNLENASLDLRPTRHMVVNDFAPARKRDTESMIVLRSIFISYTQRPHHREAGWAWDTNKDIQKVDNSSCHCPFRVMGRIFSKKVISMGKARPVCLDGSFEIWKRAMNLLKIC
jgi:hypothetical protein